jgi:hypothetical protein
MKIRVEEEGKLISLSDFKKRTGHVIDMRYYLILLHKTH